MKRSMIPMALVITLVISVCPAQVQKDAGPPKEMGFFRAYVGPWEGNAEIVEENKNQIDRFTFTFSGKFIINGYMFEMEGIDLIGHRRAPWKWICRYSQTREVYEAWVFASPGRVEQMTGNLSEDGKTITWTQDLPPEERNTTITTVIKPDGSMMTDTRVDRKSGISVNVKSKIKRRRAPRRKKTDEDLDAQEKGEAVDR